MLLPPIAAAVALTCAAQSTAEQSTTAETTTTAEASVLGAAGKWNGTISVPGQTLEFEIDLVASADGVWSGDISIDSQGAVDLALSDVEVVDSTVRCKITEIPGEPSFEGKLEGDTIAGEYSQSGMSFPFSMTRAGTGAASASASLEGISDIIEQALVDHHVPSVGVCVVYKGEVILADGFGHRHVEGKIAADGDTLYSIGSSTKAFTSFALAQLVGEGKLEWNTLVKDVLVGFDLQDEFAEDHMTVFDLLTHRSGLPRHDLVWFAAPDATRGELFAAMEHMEPNARFGERFQYQNFMYMTAGMVVEAISGQTWEAYVQSNVFGPLEMERTNFVVPGDDVDLIATNAALPYGWSDDAFDLEKFYSIKAMGPAGSIRSSAQEMGHWLQMLLAGGEYGAAPLLGEQELKYLMSNHSSFGTYPNETDQVTLGYGLGWFLESYKGHYLVQHGGNITGFTSMVALMPFEDLGIAVFANKNATGLPDKLARTIADLILDLGEDDWLVVESEDEAEGEEDEAEEESPEASSEETDDGARVAGTSPARPLASYAADYAHPAYGAVGIALNEAGDALTVALGDEQWTLEHWHYEVFRAVGDDLPPNLEDVNLHFRASSAGRITGLEALLESSIDPIVFERQPDQSLLTPERLERFVGSYEVSADITLEIARRASTLSVSQNGSPFMDLIPVEGTTFEIKNIAGFSLEFELTESGPAPSMKAYEPGGSTVCKRIE